MTFSNILHRILLEQEDRFEDLFQPLSPDELVKRNGWKKNDDGSYDVDGDVDLSEQDLKRLPVQFGKVSGNFWCYENQLTTLEGVPREVGGNFWCIYNQLTTLEGAPREVGGSFDCSYNQLTTLEGAPREVGGDFDCSYNPISVEELKKTVRRDYL